MDKHQTISNKRPASSRLKHVLPVLALLLPIQSQAEILQQLIVQALDAHPSVQALQAQTNAARIGVQSADWQFYPTPGFSVEAGKTNLGGNSRTSTLTLQQPLWTGGRLTAGKEKAEASVQSSQASLEEIRQQLALQVVQNYGDWLSGHFKTIANKKSLDAHAGLKKQLEHRIEVGVSAESDMAQIETRISSISADIALAQSQKNAALARLAQLLGKYPDPLQLSTDIARPREVGADAQWLSDQGITHSPLVQRARAEADVQKTLIDERKANLLPEVFLRAEQQFGDHGASGTTSDSRLFVGVSSRFGAGLSSLTGVEEARLLHQSAQAEVEAQKLVVNAQIQSDHIQLMSIIDRQKTLGASFKAAHQVSESYARQFLAGRRTWVDLMNAERELTQTELQIADLLATQVVMSWRIAIVSAGLGNVVGVPK